MNTEPVSPQDRQEPVSIMNLISPVDGRTRIIIGRQDPYNHRTAVTAYHQWNIITTGQAGTSITIGQV